MYTNRYILHLYSTVLFLVCIRVLYYIYLNSWYSNLSSIASLYILAVLFQVLPYSLQLSKLSALKVHVFCTILYIFPILNFRLL
jgi:threonine/homoserine efflux transporter RhtA